jgi:hypothetical protein
VGRFSDMCAGGGFWRGVCMLLNEGVVSLNGCALKADIPQRLI